MDDSAGQGRSARSPTAAVEIPGTTIILIVTPTFNSAQFLDDTILSVVSQPGDFRLRYHIQDGGSSDATMAIVRRWDGLLRSGNFPILCIELAFSYDSTPDAGMYQAINRGVARARPSQPFIMGWINSDDRLAQGALAAVDDIYRQHADVSFTCARVSMIDRQGVITGVNLPVVYDRQQLREGAHDGRSQSFVMQEGCFWRSGLWDQVDGLDERFRLAGDWDLWRRFAGHAALFTIDSVLGFHRRHDNQLSADMQRYYAEVDAADVLKPLDRADFGPGEMLKFNLGSRRWERKKRRGVGAGAPTVQLDHQPAVATRRVELTSGARHPEGPYPEVNLPAGMRWVDAASAAATITVPYPGLWRMHLRLRNWRHDLRLMVRRGRTLCLDVHPHAGEDDSDTLVTASLWLAGGRNDLEILTECAGDPVTGWRFIVLEWYVVTPAGDEVAGPAAGHAGTPDHAGIQWPAIVVVMTAYDRALDRALDAVLRQSYPNVSITVIDDDASEVNQQILTAYEPFIERLEVREGEHRQTAIGRAIDGSKGVLVVVLGDDATLAPGSLFALASGFLRDEGGDLFLGISLEATSPTPASRRLSCLPDGRVDAAELLTIGLQPQSSMIFGQGALIFSRRIWQASGAHLEGPSLASAAFDFWMKCARVGAAVRTLPVDLIHLFASTNRTPALPPDRPGDVRRRALETVEAGGVPGYGGGITRRALKIVVFDAGAIGSRPSSGCRRLATTLAAAGQRVVCLVDDQLDAERSDADAVLDAVAAERPELVLVYGARPNDRCREVVARLVAADIASINVSGLPGCSDIFPDRTASRPDLPLTSDWVVARPAGTLVYGPSGGAAGQARRIGGDGQVLHGLRAGVDMSLYRPGRRAQARRILGLPADAFIVLAVADDIAAPSDRLAVLAQAYDRLNGDAKLLLVLHHAGTLPATSGPIERADGYGSEAMYALKFAAADAVVSLLAQACELPLAQAAASGTPAIVEGEGDGAAHIAEWTFGLRLGAWTPALLSEGMERLRADPALHRRLALAGRAGAEANHSLPAAAWSFITMIARLHGFERMHLSRELHFPAGSPPFSLRSLHSPRTRPFSETMTWEGDPLPVPSGASVTGAGGIIEVSGERIALYVRAEHGGPQSLRVRGSGCDGPLTVAIAVNGVNCATLEFDALDAGPGTHLVRAGFFAGINRIDLSLATPDAAPQALMLYALDFTELGTMNAECSPPWQPLTGFIVVDQTDGEGPPNHWLDGPSATLRLWSSLAGPRRLRLSLNNYAEPVLVEVALNDVGIATIKAPTIDFLRPTIIIARVTVAEGWNFISLTELDRPASPAFGQRLSMVVRDVRWITGDDDDDDDDGGQ